MEKYKTNITEILVDPQIHIMSLRKHMESIKVLITKHAATKLVPV